MNSIISTNRFSRITLSILAFFTIISASANTKPYLATVTPAFSTVHFISPDVAITQCLLQSGNKVLIEWNGIESGADLVYEIQRSENNLDFKGIGLMMPLESNTGLQAYKFRDHIGHASGTKVFYRIKVVESNRKISYTAVSCLSIQVQTDRAAK